MAGYLINSALQTHISKTMPPTGLFPQALLSCLCLLASHSSLHQTHTERSPELMCSNLLLGVGSSPFGKDFELLNSRLYILSAGVFFSAQMTGATWSSFSVCVVYACVPLEIGSFLFFFFFFFFSVFDFSRQGFSV
uniref:Uncharacterized protein n=1 Tax=Mus musculus TaxID=10090 RepID=Q3UQ92_MOUSE|nr:unnamed protein product [Mus musculus]